MQIEDYDKYVILFKNEHRPLVTREHHESYESALEALKEIRDRDNLELIEFWGVNELRIEDVFD